MGTDGQRGLGGRHGQALLYRPQQHGVLPFEPVPRLPAHGPLPLILASVTNLLGRRALGEPRSKLSFDCEDRGEACGGGSRPMLTEIGRCSPHKSALTYSARFLAALARTS